MTEKSLEEQIKIKAQQNRKLARYMSSTEELVEEQIRKARERGEFDNLEGTGKPIDLSENPFEPPEMRMVNRMLKNNDFIPFWIQLGKDIDAATDKIWREVEQFKHYCQGFVAEQHTTQMLGRFGNRKKLFYLEKRKQFEKLKKDILNYNLHCPTFRLGRANIEVDDEMLKVITCIEDAIEKAREQ
ncbi:MAG: DUF1992 domain-containing protein [Syntrophomonadaceae bacterium]